MSGNDSDGNNTITINILSNLPEGDPQGSFTVKVLPTATGRDLLRMVCKQAHVPYLPSYELHTGEGEVIPLDQQVVTVTSVQEGKVLHWNMSDDPSVSRSKCWNMFWFMGLLSLLIGVGGIIAVCFVYLHRSDNLQYAVIFDAGSSHTSMFIYKWEGEKINSTAVAIQDGAKCTAHGGGISSYTNNTAEAGKSLIRCLDVATNRIPTDKHGSTSIYLGATAGMRLLRNENSTLSEAVLESVRNTISTYPFKFTDPKRQARIIPGSEEGAFSWITSNYVTGTFDVHPPTDAVVPELFVSSVGTLDLGGASTQITFVPNTTRGMPEQESFSADLYGTNYTLYTHSFLCYGVNEAARRVQAQMIKDANFSSTVSNPCSPKGNVLNITHSNIFNSACVSGKDAMLSFGYTISALDDVDQNTVYSFTGEGNATECRALTNSLFNFSAPCTGYDHCSFNGVYQPLLVGDFFGISTYFYMMDFLNLTASQMVDYTNFTTATQVLCAKSWQEVRWMKTQAPQSLPWFCFEALYIDTILVKGYGFDPNSTWKGIHFVESVSGVDAGWTLGFVIDESNQLPKTVVQTELTTVTFALLMILFCGFVCLFFFFARLATRRNSSKRSFSFTNNGYGAI